MNQHSLSVLSPDQKKAYDADWKRYNEAYPFIKNEPVSQDLLHEALLIKARLAIITPKTLNAKEDLKTIISANKQVNDLQRTMQVMFQRLGITHSPKKGRKEEKRRKVPLKPDKGGD